MGRSKHIIELVRDYAIDSRIVLDRLKELWTNLKELWTNLKELWVKLEELAAKVNYS